MLIFIYVSAIVVANLLVAHFGPWFSPINAFVLIGLDLALRDRLHDRWAGNKLWPKMFGLIASAGAISYILNPAAGMIAVASVVAFSVAGLVDAFVYHVLGKKHFMIKSNGSNSAGALADSIIFPTIAFGALMPAIVLLQFAAKFLGGLMWSYIIWKLVSRAQNK
jgi:hypothetical protein